MPSGCFGVLQPVVPDATAWLSHPMPLYTQTSSRQHQRHTLHMLWQHTLRLITHTTPQQHTRPTCTMHGPHTCCAVSPVTRGCLLIKASVLSNSRVASLPALLITLRASPLGCSNRALRRCSVSTICCWYSLAISGAATIACQALSVNSC